MSWLKKLFGGASSPAPMEGQTGAPLEAKPGERLTVQSYGSRIVAVPALDLMGQSATSPSGQYQLIWQDRSAQPNGPDIAGRYALLDRGMLRAEGRMDRPQDGKVADNGTFILNDWGSSEELAGTFTAFSSGGELIVERRYTANLLNNGLADDGGLAVCQACNAPKSPDSSILSVFDLEARAIIAEWWAESGWASSYEFPGDKLIRMIRCERASLRYSVHGDFLDRDLWLRDEVARGSLHVIRQALTEGPGATGLSIDDLRRGLSVALANDDQRFAANAWRLIGEVEEADGDQAAALAAYEKALALNPRIGIAMRAASLLKLSTS